jgi:hypothetical protein
VEVTIIEPLSEDLVGIAALVRVHRVEEEIVDDEQVDSDELAQFGLVGVVEARVLEQLEHVVGAEREHRVPSPAGDVAEGVGEERLADADGPDDGDVVARLDEAQRDELVEHGLVEGDFARVVPRFELHRRVEVSALRTQRAGESVTA